MRKLKEKLSAKLSKTGGFTLVEMLIVVAIIAILIAISIPLVNSALEKAREATDDANFRDAAALGNIKLLTMTPEELNTECGTTNQTTFTYEYATNLKSASGVLAPSGKASTEGDYKDYAVYKAQCTHTSADTTGSKTKGFKDQKITVTVKFTSADKAVDVVWG